MAEAVGAKSGKAYLEIREPSKDGGQGKLGRIEFQYNPKEFAIDKQATWKPTDAKAVSAKPQYLTSPPRSLTVELFLDSTDRKDHDITKDVALLLTCCEPTAKSIQQNQDSPPFVTFGWGQVIQFEACVEKVAIKYTLFTPEGKPLRGTVSLSLKEIPKEWGKQNPTSGAVAALRVHSVVEGDSLASVAYAEYRDARLWRAIAETNGIDDPMRLPAGTTLLLPDIEEAGGFR